MRTSNFNKERLNSIASIKSVEAKPKENRGSLLGLFSSQYFTIDMAMIYLYKKKKEAGIHDFLVNKLYEYSDYEIDFYIPQLCYILIKTRSAGLERFLLDKCTKNISHFLKILWYLNSYGQAEIKNKKGYMYVESVTTIILKKAEMAMVNGPSHNKLMIDTFGIPVNKKLSLTEEELDEMKVVSERKRSRIEYLSDTLRLINILVSISLKLKATEAEDRKPLLKSYIKRINVWLNYMRKKHSRDQDEYFKKLFHGILLPFSSDEKDNSTQLVRIIEDEIICFNTKKRAPYRIVIETIDMNEIKYIGSQAVPEHLADKALQASPTISVKSIKSLKALEEDDWDDLISAKFTRESSPTLTFADLNSKEKYRDLVDFGKIAKKAEAELKDTSMLKDVDLVQKYEVYRTRSGRYTQYLPPRGTIAAKQNQINLFDVIEESKTPESRTPERKVSSDLIHHQNRKRFDKVFPRKRTLERRQSFSTLEPKQKPKNQRRLSVRRLRGTELIQCLDKFKENHLPKRLLSVYTKILDKLKQETLERAKSLVAKGLASRVSRVITNVTGWGPWEELWEYKEQSIKKKSPFGQFKSYKLRSIVIKANDDLRQEVLIMQIIKKIQTIWKEAGLTLALRTYDILVTSNSSGVIEFVRDTMSLDGIKKKNPGKSLLQFFVETFKYDFEEAQKNFMDSLAAYSLICFLLQIKDRHNGNILLDAHGHIIHIDFGFVLTMSPGGINFESAPFKLTHEYVELMGGMNSATFHYFKMQLIKGFLELRKHVDSLAYILQVMMEGSDLPCFTKFQIAPFRDRFKERSTDNEAIEFVEKLIDNSYDNWRTVQYDNFQKYTNGILP